MPTDSPQPSRPWLLAAAGVAVAHVGLLYALWDGPGAADLSLPEGDTLSTEGVLIPVTPLPAPTQVATALPASADPGRAVTEPAAAPAATPDTAPPTQATPLPEEQLAQATPAEPTPAQEQLTSSPPPPPPPAGAPQSAAPPSAQWHFEVRGESKGLHYTAHATMDWRQDGQRYEARLELSAFLIGTRVQTSSGTLGPLGLQPEQFSDRARKDKRLVFDHGAHLIRLEGTDVTAPLVDGVQDRLSLFLQLSSLLAARPQAPATGEQWSIWVAGSPTADNWAFRYLDTETLQLPAGRYVTWHLQRLPRREGDQQVDLWFAPSLHHLPVRIRIQQSNGDVVDQLLSSG